MRATLYHNPRCSKSRQALALLQEKDIALDVVEYLKTPPNKKTLAQLQALLGVDVRAMMRPKETLYKSLQLGDETNENRLLQALAANPILLERPIVVLGKRAVIARPPERLYEIL